ncbi:hypothetical protein [Couchioplanes azureus]|uniref:hypothetical protein n=1 Tax=Couchioplanes caeruleus TaxID=56438 RepID=UPI001670F9CE|nr:hypothetical protein [Couchioplanes caeruleus]GGQ79467.1 hypothetical protein GCM10010166_56820 [Couchioplanes caeruleus subsp. azureus]
MAKLLYSATMSLAEVGGPSPATARSAATTRIAPVLLGAGTRLHEQEDGTPVKLERSRSAEMPHPSDLWFRVLR